MLRNIIQSNAHFHRGRKSMKKKVFLHTHTSIVCRIKSLFLIAANLLEAKRVKSTPIIVSVESFFRKKIFSTLWQNIEEEFFRRLRKKYKFTKSRLDFLKLRHSVDDHFRLRKFAKGAWDFKIYFFYPLNDVLEVSLLKRQRRQNRR